MSKSTTRYMANPGNLPLSQVCLILVVFPTHIVEFLEHIVDGPLLLCYLSDHPLQPCNLYVAIVDFGPPLGVVFGPTV